MPDLDHIRRRCRSLSLEELLREALLNTEDYVPEARQVMREELAQRIGDLKSYLASYEQAMGETLVRADGVRNFGRTSERYTGTLLLTTKGIGFSPTGRDQDPLVAPDFVSAVLLAALTDKFSESERLGQPRQLTLPIPLLARIHDSVFWFPVERIRSIELDGSVASIRENEPPAAWGLIEEQQAAYIDTWGQKTGVSIQRRVREGLWKTLKGWLGEK